MSEVQERELGQTEEVGMELEWPDNIIFRDGFAPFNFDNEFFSSVSEGRAGLDYLFCFVSEVLSYSRALRYWKDDFPQPPSERVNNILGELLSAYLTLHDWRIEGCEQEPRRQYVWFQNANAIDVTLEQHRAIGLCHHG